MFFYKLLSLITGSVGFFCCCLRLTQLYDFKFTCINVSQIFYMILLYTGQWSSCLHFTDTVTAEGAANCLYRPLLRLQKEPLSTHLLMQETN